MGYIKNVYREILNRMDYMNYVPNGWDEFIEKHKENHNLLIKSNGKCVCTNCKHIFSTTKKVNEKVKCPNCKHTYLIKRNNLKNYSFYDDLSYVEKVDDKLILRVFELRSDYNNINKDYSIRDSIVEYARIVIGERDCVFINERVSRNTGPTVVYHFRDAGNWRKYTRYYKLVNALLVFPNNLKSILNNTPYQYSMLWELLKHTNYIDYDSLFYNARYSPSVELLTKMKLYNLALTPDFLKSGKSFESRFGLSKDLYPFMKKHNITKEELEILRIYKKPNIRIIRHLQRNYRIYQLENLCEYTSIDKLLEYERIKRKKIDLYLYIDYLENAKLLGFDLKSKKYLFPKDLRKSHDALVKKVQNCKNELLADAISRRYLELSKNIYKTKKYIIIPPKTTDDFISEASQQGNCVYTNYFEKHAYGKVDIYFMREIDNISKSLVTVEVRNGQVVQSKIKNNLNPNDDELRFLKIWEKQILRKKVA